MFLCNIVLHIIRFHLPLEWCHLFIWDYRYFSRHLESSLLFMDWFKIGKGVYQDCILSPCLFKFYVEYIMQRLLCPWNSLGKNTGVGCHTLLQGIFPTQGSNSGLLHYRQILYHLSHHRCENWTVKKAEHCRIDAFELRYWIRLLRVPWTAKRSNQFILKISPGCPLEGLMLKLNLPYFGHLMQRADLLEKTQYWEKIEGRRRGQQMIRWFECYNWLKGHEETLGKTKDMEAWCVAS